MMTPERKAELMKMTQTALTLTQATAEKQEAGAFWLAKVVEALVLEIVPEVKP